MSRVAIDVLAGYFRSHPLASERIAQIRQMIRAEHWDTLAHRPQPLPVQYVFVTQRARTALYNGHYDDAIKLASRAVELKPKYGGALQTLARAQFAQADFEKAAAAYRSLLDLYPNDADAAHEYAIALAASGDHAKAAQEFAAWMRGANQPNASVDLAGLQLLSGDAGPATGALAGLRRIPAPETAAALARLGYWYYLAANYEQAAQVLSEAFEQLPQDGKIQAQLGWTLVEQRKFASAIQRFGYVRFDDRSSNMGTAVAYWQTQQKDFAMNQFGAAASAQPAWLNQRWVRAQYGPIASQSISEMQAEKQRRVK
jgi:tetratricopeptide (TPR) repeat protein